MAIKKFHTSIACKYTQCVYTVIVGNRLNRASGDQGLEQKMKKVVILNGYEIRSMIKHFGGAFRPADKAWIIGQQGFEELAKLAKSPAAGMGYIRGFAKIVAYCEVRS